MPCAICNAPSKHYVLCAKCLKKLKEEAWEETKKEFERQYNLTEGQDELFLNACWEVEHNTYYENLTKEEYKQKIFDEYAPSYHDNLVGCKLYTLKTGKPKNPNTKRRDFF